MHLRGLARIWQSGSLAAGCIVLVAMPCAVAVIALGQGTFSWLNPALFLGDPALAVVVMLGGLSLAALTSQQQAAITRPALQIGLVSAGWVLGVLSEWFGRWQADQRWQEIGVWHFIKLSYRVSDIYHFVLYGPLAAIVALSLIAIATRAIVQPSVVTITIAVSAVMLVALWGFLAWKTGEMMKAEAYALVQ